MLSNTWDANRRFTASLLPIYRLFKAYSYYQNGKRNKI